MTHEQLDAETFRDRYGPWALVAGASDGIGACFARELASRGLNVILLARRQPLLEELASDLRAQYRVETRVIAVDLTGEDMDTRVAAATADLEVGTLVYNAGAVHGARKFHDQSIEHALALVDLNCRGPLLLAHRFGGPMRERGRGGILLLTSLAALSGSSYTASYNATKSFDLILAESLWHELQPDGVDVLAVMAGATRTPSMLSSSTSFATYPGIMEPDAVASGALGFLGQGPCWVAGAANRQAAKGLLPVPRTAVINAVSKACSQIYHLPFVPVEGVDFSDFSDPE